ncbi:MAG: helix-turn-helix transcriptional regulator [Chitinophagaceae bacterium]|nr:helix-turn-helix transcriptional regulator [Chitinophagaceae bacterium]
MNPITSYRKRNRLTQIEFAKQLGISQQRLSYYENGMEPPLEFIHKFKHVTSIDLLDVITEMPVDTKYEMLVKENEMLRQLLEEKEKRLELYEKLLNQKP